MDTKPFYPADWQDDQTMDVLFSPFRENRDINPHSWDQKMRFWTDLIKAEIRHSNMTVFNVSQFPNSFRRKNKLPVCLSLVLSEMQRQGDIVSLRDFESSCSGWVSWGFGVFVKKPLSWTFGKLMGSKPSGPEGEFVMPAMLKSQADAVLERHYSTVQNEQTDNVLELSELWRRSQDLVRNEYSLQLVLMQLQKDGKVSLVDGSGRQKLVCFARQSVGTVQPPTEVDEKILKLKKSEEYVKSEIGKLSRDMEGCRLEAKEHLKNGLRSSAKNCLRRKKGLERKVEHHEAALDTIHSMIQKIRDAESNKMILDAYEAGSSAFRDIAKSHGLTPENIDDVMSNVQDVFDAQAELDASMAQGPIDGIGEPSMAELELELEDIMADKHDLASNFGDLSVKEPDFSLPEVPTHNPATPPKASRSTPPKASRSGETQKPVGFSPLYSS